MQWHQQLDHMQTTCTSLHSDNHINMPSLNFYRPGALSEDTAPEGRQFQQVKFLKKNKTRMQVTAGSP